MSNARDTAKNLKTGLNVAADGTIIDVQKAVSYTHLTLPTNREV